MIYFLYALASTIGSLLVGILGTGSSLVVLPCLILIFAGSLEGFDTLRLAAGTTMATIAVGAVSGAVMQYRNGHVNLALLNVLFLPYVVGGFLGPWLGKLLPSGVLAIYIAAIISFVALRMLFLERTEVVSSARDYRAHQLEIISVATAVGLLCSMAGVASGLLTIPYLRRFSLPMRTIIGTSTAAAGIYASCGTIGYITAAQGVENLPNGSLGYVYLPAFFIMATIATIVTPLGVHLARYVSERNLSRLLAGFLLLAAVVIIVR